MLKFDEALFNDLNTKLEIVKKPIEQLVDIPRLTNSINHKKNGSNIDVLNVIKNYCHPIKFKNILLDDFEIGTKVSVVIMNELPLNPFDTSAISNPKRSLEDLYDSIDQLLSLIGSHDRGLETWKRQFKNMNFNNAKRDMLERLSNEAVNKDSQGNLSRDMVEKVEAHYARELFMFYGSEYIKLYSTAKLNVQFPSLIYKYIPGPLQYRFKTHFGLKNFLNNLDAVIKNVSFSENMKVLGNTFNIPVDYQINSVSDMNSYFDAVDDAANKIRELSSGMVESADDDLITQPTTEMDFDEHNGVPRFINWVRGYAIERAMNIIWDTVQSNKFYLIVDNVEKWREMKFKYSSDRFFEDAETLIDLAMKRESILNAKLQPQQSKVESFGSFYTKNEVKERSESDSSKFSNNKDLNSGQFNNKKLFNPRQPPESIDEAVSLIKRKSQGKHQLNLKELEYIKNKYKDIEIKLEKNHKDYLQRLYEKRGVESPFTKETNVADSFKTFLTQNSTHMDQVNEEPWVEVYDNIPIGNQVEYSTRTCDIIENFGLNALNSTKANIPDDIKESLTRFNLVNNLQEVNTR
ncbi:MAG: hypothetical protein L0K68_12590, partial [Tetragenococcus koreensis]|nr:hypothetical protein [Tetragenococcus koreensis]